MNFTTLNPKEVINASADALLLAMGHKVDRPHPLAQVLSEDGALSNIAYAAGQVALSHRFNPGQRVAALGAGLNTEDFAEALAEAGKKVTFASYGQQARHMRFCGIVNAKNFKAFDVPGVGFDVVPRPLGPNAEIEWGTVESVAGAKDLRLAVYGRVLEISRKAVINNDVLQVDRLFAAFGAASARLEAQLVVEALESTAALDDGQPVFHADFGNVLTPSAFSSAQLALAIKLLRKQRSPGGQFADLEIRHLVVDPENESIARRLVLDEGHDFEVTAMADMPAGRWYALADQKVAPTISVIRLAGTQQPLRLTRLKKPPVEVDGMALKGVADLGATLLGRVGIVRGGGV